MSALQNRRIVLGLSGGVACYKSAELCRLFVKAGANVQVVMSEGAQAFITPTTLQALSGQRVITSQRDAAEPNAMPHINATRGADAMVIAPASANLMSRMAAGAADETLALMCLARPPNLPLLLAPAMNREMWAHPATQRNVAQLQADGAVVLGVGSGEQACGEVGDGRMWEPDAIFDAVLSALSPKPLAGKVVCITAGPTFEPIDPVRGITNRSSGKMGFAMARAAALAGAQVRLVAGPVALATPGGVAQRIDVNTALEMASAVQQAVQGADIFIATAAVADWRPAASAEQKIKKDGSGATPSLAFTENPDILATVAASAAAKSGQLYCVGFAAETENLIEHGRAKRLRKGVPMLVGNLGPSTFGQDDNALVVFTESGELEMPRSSKWELASKVIALIAMKSKAIG